MRGAADLLVRPEVGPGQELGAAEQARQPRTCVLLRVLPRVVHQQCLSFHDIEHGVDTHRQQLFENFELGGSFGDDEVGQAHTRLRLGSAVVLAY